MPFKCKGFYKLHGSLMARPSRQGGEHDAVGLHSEMATQGLMRSFVYYSRGHSVRKPCALIKGGMNLHEAAQ